MEQNREREKDKSPEIWVSDSAVSNRRFCGFNPENLELDLAAERSLKLEEQAPDPLKLQRSEPQVTSFLVEELKPFSQ